MTKTLQAYLNWKKEMEAKYGRMIYIHTSYSSEVKV